MGQAEFKTKLGNRGSIRGEKTFNTSSGTQGGKTTPQMSWQGKTKGDTTHKKK